MNEEFRGCVRWFLAAAARFSRKPRKRRAFLETEIQIVDRNTEATAEIAAVWLARLESPAATASDRILFERWRLQNALHEQACALLERLSQSLVQHGASDQRLQSKADHAYKMGARQDARDRDTNLSGSWRFSAALAAAIAIIGFGGYFVFDLIHIPAVVAYFTHAGERRDIALSDGSLVHLDVESHIEVSFVHGARQVNLESGRAFFEVAHDPGRPFTVSVNGEYIKALGTRFQVERQKQTVLVTLTQGSVVVFDRSSAAQSHRQTLRPGEQLSIDLGKNTWSTRVVDTQVATSWSLGRLIFRATPLAEALSEINRYAAKPVRLGDPALASIPISGNFIPGNSALAVSAISAVLPLRAVDSGQEIVLLRSQEPAAPQEASD